jgi:hypothetical protein
MPPALAARYTTGELAVLRIVGDEIHAKGTCTASLGEIAPRAGVCRKLVQLTLRRAARDGLITIERPERRIGLLDEARGAAHRQRTSATSQTSYEMS